MKKNILFYFMLCHVSLLLAGVRIKQFQHPNTFPYNGFIIVEANDPQKPYTIVIKGISTGYTSTVRDVSTEYKFSPLGPDLYEIEVFGSTGCGVVKLSQLLSPCDRLKITPVIKENCFVRKSGKNSPFVETKGSITLNITGGRQPFTFEWRDNNNLNRIISTSKDLLNLSKGTFTVLVKDLDGCMFSQTFTLNGFFMSTKNISRIDQCYTKSEFTIEMDPISIKQYNWSDGTVGRKIVGRHVFNNEITQGHSVTITEPTSQCQIIEALYGPKGTWYWEIKGFKNPSSIGVKDGWVDLVENLTGYSGFIPDPQKIVIMRNGVFYRENVYSTNSSRVYRVNSLEEGDYLFYWKDKEGCDIAAQSIVLYACNGGLHNPSIEITSYALPPSSPNSYVEAIASYQYGSINECKYNWYSSFYNVTTTLVPRLTNAELKKFYSSTTGDLCVKMICPCGEATSCVKFNPCHPDAKFVYTKKDIGSICVGTLPSGKYIETNPKASINIEIDATRYMDIGPLGLPQFNKRIANISWEDGTAVNASYNNNANLLTITRETDKAGEFKLILVTGTGCTIFETYKIENAFEITYSSNATCSFWVKCKGEPGEGTRYLEGRLANINFQSCTVDLMCGDNLIQTAYGFTSKNEYLSTGSTSCIARKWCIFNSLPIIEKVNNPNVHIYLTDPTNPDFSPRIYGIYQDSEVPCCTDKTLDAFNSELINDHDNNPFDNVDINDLSSNPCTLAVKCLSTGYYFIMAGNQLSNTVCRTSNGACRRCIKCQFNDGGNVFEIPEKCYPLSTRECSDKSLCPGELSPPEIVSSEEQTKRISIIIMPNPFKEFINIQVNSIDANSANFIEIQIYDSNGKLLRYLNKKILHSSSNIEVETNDFEAGFYIVKCKVPNEIIKSFKMIKI